MMQDALLREHLPGWLLWLGPVFHSLVFVFVLGPRMGLDEAERATALESGYPALTIHALRGQPALNLAGGAIGLAGAGLCGDAEVLLERARRIRSIRRSAIRRAEEALRACRRAPP
jgi:hypothetical protein